MVRRTIVVGIWVAFFQSASNSRANRGRNQEVSGECPFLAGEVAFAFVTNLQKEGDQKHLKTVSTPKHFLAYDLEEEAERVLALRNGTQWNDGRNIELKYAKSEFTRRQ